MWILPSTPTAVKPPTESQWEFNYSVLHRHHQTVSLTQMDLESCCTGVMEMVSFPGFPSLLKSPGNSWGKQKELSCQSLGTNPVFLLQSTAKSCVCPAPHQWELWGPSSSSHHMKLKMARTRQVTDIPEKKANSGTSSLPSTRTPQSQTPSRLQWLDNFRCLGGLTHCTSGCPGLVSLLQPQQLNHLRDEEVQKQINSR